MIVLASTPSQIHHQRMSEMTEAVSANKVSASTTDPSHFQRELPGFSMRVMIGLLRRRHGAAVVERILARVPHLAQMIEQSPTWIIWQQFNDLLIAAEAEIPNPDPGQYHEDWLRNRLWTLPLFGLLRAGAPPESIYANAGRIIRMISPSLVVTTTFISRGAVVDFIYTLRFPVHCPSTARRWVTAGFTNSHSFLPQQSPRVRSLRVETLPDPDAHTVAWRIRWLTARLWWPLAALVIASAALGWYLIGWHGASFGAMALAAWWLGQRESHADAHTLAGFLNLSDKAEGEHRELAMRRRHLASSERRHQAGIVAARMVHELSGPLSVLRMTCDHLRSESHDDRLEMIAQAVERIERIVQTVRSAHQSAPPTRSEQCVEDVLRVIESTGRDLGGPTLLELTVTPPAPSLSQIRVTVVAGAIEMIADNLLRNARDAALPGRPAQVTVTALVGADGRTALRFSDQGIGMTPELARLAIAGLSSKEAGLGIGLALCCELALQMGAGLRIVRTAPGQGTEIEIRWES